MRCRPRPGAREARTDRALRSVDDEMVMSELVAKPQALDVDFARLAVIGVDIQNWFALKAAF